MTFALEVWRDGASWITLATFGTRAEAKCRAWELHLPIWRVREVGSVA